MSKPVASPGDADVSYPGEFPFNSVKEIVRIINGKSLSQERAAFGKHIWTVQGYAQSQLLGDPDTEMPNLLDDGKVADPVVNMLEEILNAHERKSSSPSPQALVESGAPMVKMSLPAPMAMLLKWSVSQLMVLLEQELAAAMI